MYCTIVFCYVILRLCTPTIFTFHDDIHTTNADLYRSIAISSILSKILDYVIIDQQVDSLATTDY